jgi:ribonuclease HI
MLKIYCDGSSTGRVGIWGWGYVIVEESGDIIAYGYGGGSLGTNNIGELSAAISGLEYVIDNKLATEVEVVSDSQYVLGMIEEKSVPNKNLELIHWLLHLKTHIKVKTKWVRGHSGDKYNEIADKLAKKGKEIYKVDKCSQ